MESIDEYIESQATNSVKSPAKKDANKKDAYTYFMNKQRAEKGLAPVKDDDSDVSDSEEAKESDRTKEDPGIAKIKADMARRKAEALGKKHETPEVDPGMSSSESYTESPVSAAQKAKASPEPEPAKPKAKQ